MRILRPITSEDLEHLNKWRNDRKTFKYLGGGYHPTSIDEQKKWLDKMMKIDNKNNRFIIQDLGRPVGMIGLYNINLIHQHAEIGIYIAEKSTKGISHMALNELLDYAKNFLNIKKVFCYTVESNENATRFFKNANFMKVGCLNNHRFIDGCFHNLLIWEKFLNE